MSDSTPLTRKSLLARLNQPVDAGNRNTPAADTNPKVGSATTDPAADRAARAAARSADLYQRKLRNAQTGGETAVFMAHVDRVRALHDPTLTRDAATVLADLIARHTAARRPGSA